MLMRDSASPQVRNFVKMACGIVLIILILLSGMVFYVSQDWLTTTSISIIIAYCLAFLVQRFYLSWLKPIAQLQSFIEAKQLGQSNLTYVPTNPNHPISILGFKVQTLLDTQNLTSQPNVENVFLHWPHPVAMFDKQMKLCFFNPAMLQAINLPILRGMNFGECGFQLNGQNCTHSALKVDWQIQYIKLPINDQHLIIANNIGQPLRFAKQASQLSMIRVLTHELNNSLTPFASIADTLLDNPQLPEKQTREALTRIRDRSESLLKFINGYGQLHRLPEIKSCEFNIHKLLLSNASEHFLQVEYKGYDNYFGDPILIEQLLVNILKNAHEAGADNIYVINHNKGLFQCLTITDNGPGFANLHNATQPLYTTKTNGSGLGLALCNAIAVQHGGSLNVYNTTEGGQIEILLPNRTKPLTINYG